jgi:hypothetical protein
MIKLVMIFIVGIVVGYGTAFIETRQHDAHVQETAELACTAGIVETITYLYGKSDKEPNCEAIANQAIEISK